MGEEGQNLTSFGSFFREVLSQSFESPPTYTIIGEPNSYQFVGDGILLPPTPDESIVSSAATVVPRLRQQLSQNLSAPCFNQQSKESSSHSSLDLLVSSQSQPSNDDIVSRLTQETSYEMSQLSQRSSNELFPPSSRIADQQNETSVSRLGQQSEMQVSRFSQRVDQETEMPVSRLSQQSEIQVSRFSQRVDQETEMPVSRLSQPADQQSEMSMSRLSQQRLVESVPPRQNELRQQSNELFTPSSRITVQSEMSNARLSQRSDQQSEIAGSRLSQQNMVEIVQPRQNELRQRSNELFTPSSRITDQQSEMPVSRPSQYANQQNEISVARLSQQRLVESVPSRQNELRQRSNELFTPSSRVTDQQSEMSVSRPSQYYANHQNEISVARLSQQKLVESVPPRQNELRQRSNELFTPSSRINDQQSEMQVSRLSQQRLYESAPPRQQSNELFTSSSRINCQQGEMSVSRPSHAYQQSDMSVSRLSQRAYQQNEMSASRLSQQQLAESAPQANNEIIISHDSIQQSSYMNQKMAFYPLKQIITRSNQQDNESMLSQSQRDKEQALQKPQEIAKENSPYLLTLSAFMNKRFNVDTQFKNWLKDKHIKGGVNVLVYEDVFGQKHQASLLPNGTVQADMEDGPVFYGIFAWLKRVMGVPTKNSPHFIYNEMKRVLYKNQRLSIMLRDYQMICQKKVITRKSTNRNKVGQFSSSIVGKALKRLRTPVNQNLRGSFIRAVKHANKK